MSVELEQVPTTEEPLIVDSTTTRSVDIGRGKKSYSPVKQHLDEINRRVEKYGMNITAKMYGAQSTNSQHLLNSALGTGSGRSKYATRRRSGS